VPSRSPPRWAARASPGGRQDFGVSPTTASSWHPPRRYWSPTTHPVAIRPGCERLASGRQTPGPPRRPRGWPAPRARPPSLVRHRPPEHRLSPPSPITWRMAFERVESPCPRFSGRPGEACSCLSVSTGPRVPSSRPGHYTEGSWPPLAPARCAVFSRIQQGPPAVAQLRPSVLKPFLLPAAQGSRLPSAAGGGGRSSLRRWPIRSFRRQLGPELSRLILSLSRNPARYCGASTAYFQSRMPHPFPPQRVSCGHRPATIAFRWSSCVRRTSGCAWSSTFAAQPRANASTAAAFTVFIPEFSGPGLSCQ